MNESPTQQQPGPGQARAGQTSFWTIIVALLFLYLGFWAPFVPYADDSTLQKLSIHAFNWMARIVGIGLLLSAALAYGRVSLSQPVDFGLATLAAVGCLGAGTIWLINGYSTGLLIVIFGVLNAASARAAWLNWQGRR